MSAPILQVTNLSLLRDGITILDSVHWTVRRGHHWAVLGANGSGKTSLIAAVTGYLMPTQGEIDLLGERYGESDWRALRTRIGIVSSSIRQLMADSEPALHTVASGRHAMIDYWGDPLAPSTAQWCPRRTVQWTLSRMVIPSRTRDRFVT